MAVGVYEMHNRAGVAYDRWAEELGRSLDRVRAGLDEAKRSREDAA